MTCVAQRQRIGFTLVEILVVVSLLSILAAVVIPKFTDASDEAMESALVTNLQLIRNQIDLYRHQHGGRLPHLNQKGKNNTKNFTRRLLEKTDPTGKLNPNGSCGPYLTTWPANPFSTESIATKVLYGTRTKPRRNDKSGWYYNRNAGMIYANSRTGGESLDPQ
jgi:general secretion pathway protein G